MKTTIYYFTASSNSSRIAEEISRSLENVTTVYIPEVMSKKEIYDDSNMVGIITPVYVWGAARMAAEFAEKLRLPEQTYLFTIANSGGIAGYTNIQMDRIFKKKGKSINAGFAVKESSLSLFKDELPVKIAKFLAGKKRDLLLSFNERKEEILSIIKNRKPHVLESTNFLTDLYAALLHDKVIEVFKSEDRHFEQGDNCIQCGKCVKTCPRDNLKLVNHKLQWLHNCEQCFRCYTSCQYKALKYKGKTV